jgi:hypothetical protein
MGRLNDLGVKYGTDKSSICHDYLDFYEEIFQEFGLTEKKDLVLLEIGVFGAASIKMWKEFFQLADIYGIDINIEKKHIVSDVQFIKVDAYSKQGLYIVGYSGADIIIDDGSHNSADIIKLVDFLTEGDNIEIFPFIFIYEDCHAAFWEKYTPEGTENAYFYCKKKFEELGFDVRVKQRYGDFSDSVTMVVIKK